MFVCLFHYCVISDLFIFISQWKHAECNRWRFNCLIRYWIHIGVYQNNIFGSILRYWTQGTMQFALTHWGRVTHICVSKLTIIGSDNGLSPDRRQAIIWTNAGLLSIGPLRTNFSEILIEILTFSFEKIRLKVSSAKRRPFCLGLNVLIVVVLKL